MYKFNLIEFVTIEASLCDYNEFFLPISVNRRTIYTLMKKIDDLLLTVGIEFPNIYNDKFNKDILIDIDLTIDEIDYINISLLIFCDNETSLITRPTRPNEINLSAVSARKKLQKEVDKMDISSKENSGILKELDMLWGEHVLLFRW